MDMLYVFLSFYYKTLVLSYNFGKKMIISIRYVFSTSSYQSKKVQVGNDHEMAQSERNSHSTKPRDVKKLKLNIDTYSKKTYHKPSEQIFPNWWPLSYPNLT